MRLLKLSVYLCLVLLLTSCESVADSVAEVQAQKTMRLYVTVDWEGRSLDEENLEAMQQFRQRFPNIPMLQLLNPTYFVRPHPDYARLASDIKSTFLSIDTVGLHVHAWKSLTKHCGVAYQSDYSFADISETCKVGDCGYTVSLENAYSQADLTQLIGCSNDILMQHGFGHSVHFRAGGWQMGPKLIAALEANGFIWDSSVIDAELLLTRWHQDSSMIKMLRKLHPTATPLDQPYQLTDQIMEYPNNAALADYTTSKQLVALFQQLVDAEKAVMVLGFHQETAADFIDHLAEAIPQMEAIAKAHQIKIEWHAR